MEALLSHRRHSFGFKLTAFCLGLIVPFVLAEAIARIASSTDAYGQVTLFGLPLPPVRPPLARLASLQEELARFGERVHIDYDADLGWSPRPGATSENGLYHINAQGIRVDDPSCSFTEYPSRPRILLLGDSYTFGQKVGYADTWGAQLAALLPEMEVVNLGVGGFGLGQALLRWRKLGHTLHPQQVLFGLQTENAYRSMNLIRLFYHRNSGIPYSKPRFVLGVDDRLQLVNVPTLPSDRLEAVLEDPHGWDLAPHEGFLPAPDRSNAWVRSSSLLGYVWSVLRPNPQRARCAEIREQAMALGVRLVAQLAAEVESTGARFTVVHLPKKRTLKQLLKEGTFPERPLVDGVAAGHALIDTAPAFLENMREEGLAAFRGGHYSRDGNEVAARVIASALLTLPDDKLELRGGAAFSSPTFEIDADAHGRLEVLGPAVLDAPLEAVAGGPGTVRW